MTMKLHLQLEPNLFIPQLACHLSAMRQAAIYSLLAQAPCNYFSTM
jgi:hypothetical protein